MQIVLPRLTHWLVALTALWLAMLSVDHGLILDDAYIVFRVADNLRNGFGLRWNVDERVQVYSSPLWLLSHILLYPFNASYMVNNALLSLVCVAVMVVAMLGVARGQVWWRAGTVVLPLLLSFLFRRHMSNGLETPMVCLWLVLFWFVLLRRPGRTDMLVLLASLAILTRMDAWILLAPGLALRLAQGARGKPKAQVARAVVRLLPYAAPFLGWLAFSLLYYGFMFPNTKYAKMHSGMETNFRLLMGSCYVFYFFPMLAGGSYFFMASTLALAVARHAPGRLPPLASHGAAVLALALGIVLHMGFMWFIGGDYVVGRFLVPGLVLAAVLAGQLEPQGFSRGWFFGALALMLLPAVLMHSAPASAVCKNTVFVDKSGGFNMPTFRLPMYKVFIGSMGKLRMNDMLSAPFYRAEYPRPLAKVKFDLILPAGMPPFEGGPRFVAVDVYGLTNAFLARMPGYLRLPQWPGHYWRRVPTGFAVVRMSNAAGYMDPALYDYYMKLRVVTSYPLFALERLKTIAGFQLGLYDRELAAQMPRIMQQEGW